MHNFSDLPQDIAGAASTVVSEAANKRERGSAFRKRKQKESFNERLPVRATTNPINPGNSS